MPKAKKVSSTTATTLEKMREIQAYNWPDAPTPSATAPDFCIAAARFLVGKLVGLFPADRHLNTFLRSGDAKSLSQDVGEAKLKADWGRLSTLDEFNEKVLPQAISWGGKRKRSGDVEFVNKWVTAEFGDKLLAQGVPLVVGVSLFGTRTCDHYIAVVADKAGTLWAVDSWGEAGDGSVVELPSGSTFTKPIKADMNAGSTTIPCLKPFFGFFRNKESRTALTLAIAL
jgi:hypothetical protein